VEAVNLRFIANRPYGPEAVISSKLLHGSIL